FSDQFMIGIHYRGTDKITEASYISYDKVLQEIKNQIKNIKVDFKIFIATDDQNFLDYIKSYFKYKYDIVYLNYYRSSNNLPIHINPTKDYSAYKIGEDALMDCILLSKCNILIRTHSSLSS